MSGVIPSPALNERQETEAEHICRIQHEAHLLAEARADAARGCTVSLEDVGAWIDSLDTDHELSLPQSKR